MVSDYFIYVINLPEAKERFERIIKELVKNGLKEKEDYEIIEAIKGSEALKQEKYTSLLDDGVYEALTLRERAEPQDLGVGSFGCSLSHMKVWNIIISRKDFHSKRIPIVLEDDVQLEKGFLYKVDHLFKVVKKNDIKWDILNIGSTIIYQGNHKKILKKNVENPFNIILSEFFFLTGAMILNIETIEEKLKYMYPIRFQIDSQISYQRENVSCLLIEPSIVKLNELSYNSSIGHTPPIGKERLHQLLKEKFPKKNFEEYFKYKTNSEKITIKENNDGEYDINQDMMITFGYKTTESESNIIKDTIDNTNNIAFIVYSVITYTIFLSILIFFIVKCTVVNKKTIKT